MRVAEAHRIDRVVRHDLGRADATRRCRAETGDKESGGSGSPEGLSQAQGHRTDTPQRADGRAGRRLVYAALAVAASRAPSGAATHRFTWPRRPGVAKNCDWRLAPLSRVRSRSRNKPKRRALNATAIRFARQHEAPALLAILASTVTAEPESDGSRSASPT